MNYRDFSYSELGTALDSAIDQLNTDWRISLPLITSIPEMVQDRTKTPPQPMIPGEYTALPDDFIRMYVVPFAVGTQFILTGQDGSPELTLASMNLTKLSKRYSVNDGAKKIDTPSFNINLEDRDKFIGAGHNTYGQDWVQGNGNFNPLDPLKDY